MGESGEVDQGGKLSIRVEEAEVGVVLCGAGWDKRLASGDGAGQDNRRRPIGPNERVLPEQSLRICTLDFLHLHVWDDTACCTFLRNWAAWEGEPQTFVRASIESM